MDPPQLKKLQEGWAIADPCRVVRECGSSQKSHLIPEGPTLLPHGTEVTWGAPGGQARKFLSFSPKLSGVSEWILHTQDFLGWNLVTSRTPGPSLGQKDPAVACSSLSFL